MEYQRQNPEALCSELQRCRKTYEKAKHDHLSLDLSRGKPAPEQLQLSLKMLDTLNSHTPLDTETGIDCRNYGGLDGIPEAKRLLAEMVGAHPEEMLVGGNSSLTLMYEILSHALLNGLCGGTPWYQVPDRKFLCPSPGYDRHFAMTEHFGFQLITVPMQKDGPDMDLVERLVSEDETVKGIWCVPKYQNPTGIVFSAQVVKRFAALQPKTKDFRIFWDNAYCVHSLYPEQPDVLPDILEACRAAGHPDLVYEFCSTSKIAFPGAGIAGVAASPANLIDLRSALRFATIGPDKLNQLRQARYFKSAATVRSHMAKHAAILRPKFEAVERVFEAELGGLGIANWTKPRGGYFLSFDTLPGCAVSALDLCGQAGVKFTPAGATYPYGKDPADRNIRIAPSYAEIEEIRRAGRLLALCVRIVSLEKLLLYKKHIEVKN